VYAGIRVTFYYYQLVSYVLGRLLKGKRVNKVDLIAGFEASTAG
jgi:hypothetical protein